VEPWQASALKTRQAVAVTVIKYAYLPANLWQHSCNQIAMEPIEKTNPMVLVVDDDEDMLVLVQHKLAADGFDPICSPNGTKIMEIIARKHPDLVLLDIHMNGVDGGDICHEIKSNPDTAAIPIIILSANHDLESVARDCGADAYIQKPFTNGKFRQTISSFLKVNNKL
jgi:DNA-binding response OmpR family regulator